MTLRYYILDTETSDITPDAGVVEIAWRELDSTLNVIDEVHSRIDPEQPINPAASGVHGITNADVADEPTLAQFFETVRGEKIQGPAIIIGHQVAFDLRYVSDWIDQLSGSICTLRLARRYYPDSPNAKLSTLRYFLNLPAAGAAHSALGDVITTTELLRCLVFKSGKTLRELVAHANQPVWVPKIPFGKYKGADWNDVPRSYLQWMAGLDNLEPDTRYSLERALKEAA